MAYLISDYLPSLISSLILFGIAEYFLILSTLVECLNVRIDYPSYTVAAISVYAN